MERGTVLERHQDSFPSWFSLLPASRVLLLGWGWERKVELQAPGAVTAGVTDRARTAPI